MNGKKKIAIVGLGPMGQRYCELAGRIPNAELSAVCDQDAERLGKAAERFKVPGRHADWKPLLRQKPDLLVIATNGPSHAAIAAAAAEAGVPRILCEKPMATSLEARARCSRPAPTRGRAWPSTTSAAVPDLPRPAGPAARRHPGRNPARLLRDGRRQLASNGGHLFDTVLFLTGQKPARVLAYLDKTGTPNPRGPQFSDPGAYGILWLSGGARVFFDMCEDYGAPVYIELLGPTAASSSTRGTTASTSGPASPRTGPSP